MGLSILGPGRMALLGGISVNCLFISLSAEVRAYTLNSIYHMVHICFRLEASRASQINRKECPLFRRTAAPLRQRIR